MHPLLTTLLDLQQPHPVGSAENDAVRGRLVAHLEAGGFKPELQRGFACAERGACAPLVNVIVQVPGQVDAPAVVLAAHYDSVNAGPGAADDGSGRSRRRGRTATRWWWCGPRARRRGCWGRGC